LAQVSSALQERWNAAKAQSVALLAREFDPDEPRDEGGKWTSGGGSDGGAAEEAPAAASSTSPTVDGNKVSGIKGMPKGAFVTSQSLATAVQRGAFTFEAKERPKGKYESGRQFEIFITAIKPNGIEEYQSRARGDKVIPLYDPRLAKLVTLDKGTVIERKIPVPLDPTKADIRPLDRKDVIYRGMSAEEYEASKARGYLESRGDYNIGEAQHGLTYWSNEVQTAQSYANGFAPWQYKATFEKPAYVVAIPTPAKVVINPAYPTETGVPGQIPMSEIVAAWRGDAFDHEPGELDAHQLTDNEYQTGSGHGASARVVWSRDDGEMITPAANDKELVYPSERARRWHAVKAQSVALLERFNPNHEPGGSPEGGRFAESGGGGGGGSEGADAGEAKPVEAGKPNYGLVPGDVEKFHALKDQWATVNNELLNHVDRPDSPEAQALVGKLEKISKEIQGLHADPGTPAGIGLPGGPRDVTIVGAGPGGLAAGIFGGAEGLDTLVVESNVVAGGQARYSSRIENFPGFPIGVTGETLTKSMFEQAERLGAETKLGLRVTSLTYDAKTGMKHLTLSDGQQIDSRAVILAGGVEFRKPPIPGADGPGVIIGDGKALAAQCANSEAVVIGGSNGAAQAALGAAVNAKHVYLIARSAITKGMSDYQVTAVRNSPKITVIENDTVVKVNRDKAGNCVSIETASGQTLPCRALGVFLGSVPETKWLSGKVDRDKGGRINTNAALETNMPGVFAVGDMRTGAIGRVGVAVGEGQLALRQAHVYLEGLKPQEQPQPAKAADAEARTIKPVPLDFIPPLFDLDRANPYFGTTIEGIKPDKTENPDAARKGGTDFSQLSKFDPDEPRDEGGKWTSGGGGGGDGADTAEKPGASEGWSAGGDPAQLKPVSAGDKVAGLTVLDKVPYTDAIDRVLGADHETLGLRELPHAMFSRAPGTPIQSARNTALAERITATGEISPLIAVFEQANKEAGPYILEGGHRFDALRLLGKTSFPALTVMDTAPGPSDVGPTAFVSPNVGHLSFNEARAALSSPRQKVLAEASDDIDRRLGKTQAHAQGVVGAWSDGAENSLMMNMPGWSHDEARLALAMKGYIGDQKSALLFTPDHKGDSFLASLSIKGDLGAIHKSLLQSGLENHTLEPTADGAIVHVWGTDQATADAVDKVAGENGTEAKFSAGHGEFIGTAKQDGTDREQRDDARQQYAAIISEAAARPEFEGRNLARTWDIVRYRWGGKLSALDDRQDFEQPRVAAAYLAVLDGGRAGEPLDEAARRRARFAAVKAQSLKLLAREFDPDEPRDEGGKWTSGGGSDGGSDAAGAASAGATVPPPAAVEKQAKDGIEKGEAAAANVEPLHGSEGHPLQVSTRTITGITAKVTGNSNVDYLQPSVAAMKIDPENYAHDVGLFKNPAYYPNLRPEDIKGTDDQVIRHVIDHMKANLRWFYETTPPAVRERAALWYAGFRVIVDQQTAKYGLPDASIAATYATLSPQKDWDQNVYLGDRVLDIYTNKQNARWDKYMTARANAIVRHAKETGEANIAAGLARKVKGKTLAQLSNPDDPWKAAKLKAMWIRIYDESNAERVHNKSDLDSQRHYRVVSPEGVRGDYARNKSGSLSQAAWPSADIISGAVMAIESGGDRNLISDALGERHKVRSFYNNALDPFSTNGDVTVDTHEVGAAWAQPFSQKAAPVIHDLKTGSKGIEGASGSKNTGVQGTYGVYADALRELGAEMHIEPRVLQSVTWTAKRDRFDDAMTDKAKQQVHEVWDEYRAGDIDMNAAHAMIDKIAPFQMPNWVGAA
jgi:thioredoxin reductase